MAEHNSEQYFKFGTWIWKDCLMSSKALNRLQWWTTVKDLNFEILTVLKVLNVVCWVATLCSLIGGHQGLPPPSALEWVRMGMWDIYTGAAQPMGMKKKGKIKWKGKVAEKPFNLKIVLRSMSKAGTVKNNGPWEQVLKNGEKNGQWG
jgi:hypothetical protein